MAPKNSSSKGGCKVRKETLLLVQNISVYPSLEYSKWYVNVFRTSLDKLEKKKKSAN